METKVLESIGLTRNESKVYLALLKEGTSKTGEILKRSGLNSGKIYEILEYLDMRRKDLEEDESVIRKEIPALEKIRETKTKEISAFTYLGFRGIKTAVDEALDNVKKGQEILGMGITEKKDEKFNEFWRQWQTRRIKKKIIGKHLFSERGDYLKEFKKMKYTEARVLDGFTPVTVDIFGDEIVLIFNYNEF